MCVCVPVLSQLACSFIPMCHPPFALSLSLLLFLHSTTLICGARRGKSSGFTFLGGIFFFVVEDRSVLVPPLLFVLLANHATTATAARTGSV